MGDQKLWAELFVITVLLITGHGGRPFPFTINPLRAKQSFHLWYPGGQRLKVISFS